MTPHFNGYLKMFLHDDNAERLIQRATATEDWQTKRRRILKKDRCFQVALHVFDTDGDKRGHTVGYFTSKGGDVALSKAIFKMGNDFVSELRADGVDVDLVNSYAVVRA